MSKITQGYRRFISELEKRLAETGDYSEQQLQHMITTTQQYMQAAGDLSKDEWAFIAAAVREDLKNWHEDNAHMAESPSWRLFKEGCWHWLIRLSDTTQLEWQEVNADLSHQGIYNSGDYIGLGTLECCQCGYKRQVWQPEQIDACPNCGHPQFYRRPLDLTHDY